MKEDHFNKERREKHRPGLVGAEGGRRWRRVASVAVAGQTVNFFPWRNGTTLLIDVAVLLRYDALPGHVDLASLRV